MSFAIDLSCILIWTVCSFATPKIGLKSGDKTGDRFQSFAGIDFRVGCGRRCCVSCADLRYPRCWKSSGAAKQSQSILAWGCFRRMRSVCFQLVIGRSPCCQQALLPKPIFRMKHHYWQMMTQPLQRRPLKNHEFERGVMRMGLSGMNRNFEKPAL